MVTTKYHDIMAGVNATAIAPAATDQTHCRRTPQLLRMPVVEGQSHPSADCVDAAGLSVAVRVTMAPHSAAKGA